MQVGAEHQVIDVGGGTGSKLTAGKQSVQEKERSRATTRGDRSLPSNANEVTQSCFLKGFEV